MSTCFLRALPGLAFLALLGCAGRPLSLIEPEPAPLTREFSAPGSDGGTFGADSSREEATGVLSLTEALKLAFRGSPVLAVFETELRAREAEARQAGRRPNPEFALELENLAGSGGFNGTGAMETTASLSQILDPAGKRGKRRRVAEMDRTLAWWDGQTARLDLYAEVKKDFLEVLAAQERTDLNVEFVNLAEESLTDVSRRVRAGSVSPVEETRARVEVSMSRLELRAAEAALASARARLAATWGSSVPRFERASGVLRRPGAPPAREAILERLHRNPDLARWKSERERREADLALQRALGKPDPVVTGGVRRLNESADQAFVLGLTLPLPLSDRNQGGRLAAALRRDETTHRARAAVLAAGTSASVAYNRLTAAAAEVVELEDRILPDARSALETARDAYSKGLFRLTDVLDTRRTLFELRRRHLDALARYHRSLTDLERLIGERLSDKENP